MQKQVYKDHPVLWTLVFINSNRSIQTIQVAKQPSNQATNLLSVLRIFPYSLFSPTPNMQFTSILTFLISFALFFQGIDALARSKLDQYTTDDW
jgi:hypothetical protein